MSWPQSPRQQRLAAVVIAVSLGIIGVAQVDLHRRPASGIRGDKRLWRLACLNAIPALVYLFWGRHPG